MTFSHCPQTAWWCGSCWNSNRASWVPNCNFLINFLVVKNSRFRYTVARSISGTRACTSAADRAAFLDLRASRMACRFLVSFGFICDIKIATKENIFLKCPSGANDLHISTSLLYSQLRIVRIT